MTLPNRLAYIACAIAHESVHTLHLLEGRFYIDDVGKRMNELEAYAYILNNAEKFDLTDPISSHFLRVVKEFEIVL